MLLYIFVFVFGLIVGSFLNVVILRHNTGRSAMKSASRCFSCGKKLPWHELIPVLSFLMQRGRCRKCGAKISLQYPAIEILTGVMFLLVFFNQSPITYYQLLITVYYWVIFSLLIIISAYDLRHQIIPDRFVYAFDIFAFLSLFQVSSFNPEYSGQISNFLAGLALFSFFWAIWLLSKGAWMGLGDAKLALGIGWLLGPEGGITAFLLAFWIGAIFGILLVFLKGKRYNLKSSVPFGPFLALGTLFAFFLNGIMNISIL